MKRLFLLSILFVFMTHIEAQNKDLPYAKIPEAAENYTAGTVVSRMLDGLGFRYYWAMEGLRAEDLSYKPNKDARTTKQTLDHVLGLSQVIVNSALGVPNGTPQPEMTFAEKRNKTLENIEKASQIFRNADDLSKFTIVFKRGEQTSEFPFWNQLNGPIGDALWHVGQVVSFRRSSGNPFPKGVSVFMGTKN